MTGSRNADAAKAVIDFLRTPDAMAVFKAKGLEPA
jgi:ABC-type Fe3+ transport system substrate-binding protein